MSTAPGEFTRLLISARSGDSDAGRLAFECVYEELRGVARAQRGRSAKDDTLGTTGLVHEVFLRLADTKRLNVKDRGHFFALAARAMRQILVDQARRRSAEKRGGGAAARKVATTLLDASLAVDAQADELLALEDALVRLADVDGRLAQVVELRFFGGLSEVAAAEALGVTERTVRRDWRKARAILFEELTSESG